MDDPNKFSATIDEPQHFFYISDFVKTDKQDNEYRNKFSKYDAFYARTNSNSGIYLLKLYYR